MLTLQELKQVVGNREERRKVPSARYLRENDVAVVKQRLIDGAEIIAYQTGYVFYCVGDYGTVFPLFTCRDYVYEAGRKITVVKEDFFDNQPWYVRLILEGEDRLCRNREVREHNNCISYSHISEGWCELVDKRQNILEKLIIEEVIGEFMDLLTDRQRQVIHQIYFQQRTQREVSRVFGITEPAVSKCISQAKQKMRRNAGRLTGVLQKGEQKMRGKKPKERQRYVLRVNETLVEVTRDVYLAWYQSRRKERYQLEKMQKNGVCGIEKVGETSYNSYLHILSPEEIVIRVSEIQELQEALKYLSEEEMELIRLLFFEEYTVKKTAQYFGCCTKTIRNRKNKVLQKLKDRLETL